MKPKSTLRSFLAIASSSLLAISYTHAATYYWDGTTVGGTGDGLSQGGATGAWDITTVNWDQGSGLARIVWPNDTTLGNTDTAVFGGTAGTVTLGADITVGGLTFNTTGYVLASDTGTRTLSFGPGDNTILFNNIAAASTSSGATVGLKLGGTGNVILSTSNPATAGTLTLNYSVAANHSIGWSGTTTINAGMTLALGGRDLSLSSTSGITLNGGGITLTNSNSTQGAFDRVASVGITSNGGAISYSNTSGTTQTYAETIGTVSLNRGQLNVFETATMSAGNLQTLTLSGLSRLSTATSAVAFGSNSGLGATNLIKLGSGGTVSNANTTAGQIIGPWALYGTAAATITDYAIFTNGDGTVALAGNTLTAPGETGWGSSTTAYRATSTTETLAATRTAAALRYTAGAGAIALGASNFNLETYSILNGGSGTLTISTAGTGGLTTPTGGGNLYLTTGAAAITVSAPINDNGGAVTLVKSGAASTAATGTLTLSGTNTFTGGVVLNAGTLVTTSNANLGVGGGITVNGTASWNASTGTDRSITINEGGILTFTGASNQNYSGVLSGNGIILHTGNNQYNFTNANNTFTGTVNNGYTMQFTSLGDSTNAINLQGSNSTFSWVGGSKTFALRPFTIQAVGSGVIQNNGGGALTIQQNLAITGAAGARTLTLQGGSTQINTFAGNIADGTSGGASVVSLNKGGSGTWALSGTNTYSGVTTNSQNNPAHTGFIFQGMQALSPNTSITESHGGGSGGHGQIRFLDDSATPASRSTVNLTHNQTNASQNVMSLFVGNNNVANGGTSSSAQAGSIIQLGNMNFTQSVTGATGGTGLVVGGANGYKLQLNNVNVTLQAAYNANWNVKLQGDGGAIVVAGNVQQAAGSGAATTTTLQLNGANTGNSISGNILNSADGTARLLSVTKNGIGTWALSGTNGYTGGTTITTGKVLFSGANSLPTTGTIAVGAAGHLSLADGTARTQTVSALTLTSLGSLSFDWTGSGTGDQLTSTANITPTAGSRFVVNLNRSGTPAGPLTLLTGGATSTLSSSTFYLANLTDFTATLTTPTVNTLVVNGYTAATPLTTLYWQGNKLAAGAVAGVDNAWALSDGTKSNWSTTPLTTYTATALTPGPTANVFFSNVQSGKTQQNGVLGADVSVNSVTIDDSSAVTIAGANGAAMTLNSTATTAGSVNQTTGVGTAGSAITVTSNAVTPTISSRVILGADQTWHVAGSKTLTVSGIVSGAFGLTKASTGRVDLTALPEYTGTTTINAGTLTFGGGIAGGASIVGNTSAITLSQGATLSFNPSVTASSIYTVAAPITLSGGAGTASIRVGGNETRLYLSGNVTGQSGVAQTLSISQGTQPGGAVDNGDRENIRFSGVIADGGSGGTLGVSVNFAGASTGAQNAFVNLSGQNTFTGNLTVTNSKNLAGPAGTTLVGAWLTIGGERSFNSGSSIGNGYLGGGNYSGNISMSAGTGKTTVSYFSTADQTLGGIISGSAALQMDGTGTLTLTNTNNSYTGSTTINSGTLAVSDIDVVANPNALGQSSAAAANLILRGGTLKYTTGDAASTDRNFALASSSTIDASGAGALNFSQTGDVSPDVTGLTFNAAGGAKLLTNLSSTANLVVGMSVTGTGIAAGSTIQSIDSASQVTLASSGNVTAGTSVAAAFGYGSRTLTLTGTNTGANTIAGNLVNSTAAGTGVLAVTKNGAGTWLLSGTNTYTGATTVTGGKLLINGSTHASSAVTVAAGTTADTPVARLGGTGTIGGNVSLTMESAGTFKNGGVLAPTAAATGTALDVTGTTTFATGSIFEWNMSATDPTSDPGVVSDSGSYGQLAGTGAITGSNAVFMIALGAGNAFTDNFWNSNKSWTNVFTGAGATLDLEDIFASFGGTNVSTAGVVTGQGSFSFTTTSTLNWTAVPEPTSALAGLLLGAGLLRRRRK